MDGGIVGVGLRGLDLRPEPARRPLAVALHERSRVWLVTHAEEFPASGLVMGPATGGSPAVIEGDLRRSNAR